MADLLIQAAIRSAGLEVAVATSTELAKDGQRAHALATSSAVALGRLLTASALLGGISKRRGTTSIQIVTQARFKQVYADSTNSGDVRGYIRNVELDLPVVGEEQKTGRRTLSIALLPGTLSIVRSDDNGEFTQGTTEMVTGEIDTDVEHFLEQSDQVPTAIACDVLTSNEGVIECGAGIIVQALPGGDEARLASIRTSLRDHNFATHIRAHAGDAEALLKVLCPDAVAVQAPHPIRWKCRCSMARVLGALTMMGPTELAEMTQQKKSVQVNCDLCAAVFVVEPQEIEQIFLKTVKAEG